MTPATPIFDTQSQNYGALGLVVIAWGLRVLYMLVAIWLLRAGGRNLWRAKQEGQSKRRLALSVSLLAICVVALVFGSVSRLVPQTIEWMAANSITPRSCFCNVCDEY